MARLFAAVPGNDLPEGENYNVCPTQRVAVIWQADGVRHLGAMRWGFLPVWYKGLTDGPLLINARAETVAQKPAFRAAVRARRCLVPADGYYEWFRDGENNRLPWYFSRQDGAPLVLAGIWQDWEQGSERLRSCAIVTTEANAATQAVHHRMPVILEPEDWAKWLGEEGHGAARLMQPAGEEVLTFHRVSRAVNSNRAHGPELIEPIKA